jgi:septal ring factor EnvC (AmiA/AmiB activator)
MTPEQKADKLDAELKDQEVAMAQLQSKVGENKEASEELNKSLQKLDAVTEKVEGEKG